jgi:hypothetical protein
MSNPFLAYDDDVLAYDDDDGDDVKSVFGARSLSRGVCRVESVFRETSITRFFGTIAL